MNKGNNLNSGLVWAPYVLSSVITESIISDNFTPSKNLLSRYTTKIVLSGTYGVIGKNIIRKNKMRNYLLNFNLYKVL